MTLLQHYQLSLFLTGITAMALGLAVFLKRRSNKAAQFFCLYTILVGWWTWGQAQVSYPNDPATSLMWFRVAFCAVLMFPVLLTHFFSAFLGIDQRKVCLIGWLLVIGFLPFISSDHFLRANGALGFLPFIPRAGPLFLPYNLIWLGWIIYDFLLLARGLQHEELWRRRQTRLLLSAFVFGYIMACTNYLYFYGICLIPFQPFLCYGVPIAFLVIAYGVFAYELFDIQVVIRRSILYTILITLLVVAYFGVMNTVEQFFQGNSIVLNQLYAATSGINSATSFLLGLFILVRNPRSKLSQLWCWMSLAIAIWAACLSVSFGVGPQNYSMALTFVRLADTVAIFIPLLYLHFIVEFLGRSDQLKILRTCYAFSIFLACFGFSPLYIPGLETKLGFINYNVAGPLFGVFVVLYCCEPMYAMSLLWQARQKAVGVRRTHMAYVMAAGMVGFVVGATFFPLCFGIPLQPIGGHLVWLYCLFVAWAVFKYQLFDIRVVIRRSLVYSILVTLLTVSYFGLIYAVERFFQRALGYQAPQISLAAFAFMALVFQPLKVGIQRLVDWLLYRAPREDLLRKLEKLEGEVRHTDKLKAVATLAAGMAHEIKNPLASLKVFADFLPSKGNDPVFRQKFQRIANQEIGKIDCIVHRLLDFAKPHPPQLRPMRVSQVIDETLELLNNECIRCHIAVERSYNFYDMIRADSQQLRQAFLNLLLNSVEAMTDHGGTLSIKTSIEGELVRVSIEDSGSGIPQIHLERIFEPFFTTKSTGTGLGLSIAHSIIQEHSGRIMIENANGHGVRCVLTFPLLTQWLGTLIHP